MANIKQQKKRIGISARQRLENLRYKSSAKTLLKVLQLHVNTGDKEAAASVHKELVQLLDRAAARKVLHRNTVNRKKARASRILIMEPVKDDKVIRRSKKKAPLRKPKAADAVAKKAAAKKPATKAPAVEPVVEATPEVEPVAEATPEVEPVVEATPEVVADPETPAGDAS